MAGHGEPPQLSAAQALMCDEVPPGGEGGEGGEGAPPPAAADEAEGGEKEAAARPEKPTSVGLHGLTRKQAVNARILVYYEEEGQPVRFGVGIKDSRLHAHGVHSHPE